jgi:hypothetical protein
MLKVQAVNAKQDTHSMLDFVCIIADFMKFGKVENVFVCLVMPYMKDSAEFVLLTLHLMMTKPPVFVTMQLQLTLLILTFAVYKTRYQREELVSASTGTTG